MTMASRLAVCALGALASITPALGANLNYNQLDLGVSYYGQDDVDLDGLGVSVNGSREWGQYLVGRAGISLSGLTLDGDDYAQQLQLQLGLGTALPLGDKVDFLAGVSLQRISIDYEYYDKANETGYAVNAGLRGLLGERFDWTVGVDYYDWGSGADGIVIGAGFRAYLRQKFAMGLDFARDTENDSFRATLGFRFDFGTRK